MNRVFYCVLLAIIGLPIPGVCCDCRAQKPACAYLAADAFFLGRVSLTNDDRSRGINQATLVRFDVEERFKGVNAEVRQIWVDPGSFTSCYQRYSRGERYLIFATLKTKLPNDAVAMSVIGAPEDQSKPLPPGFDRTNPPPVYYAPECAGARSPDYPNFDNDLVMLRAYRAGSLLPRVLGNVYLYPFRGWPQLNGPPLMGARVTMSNGAVTLRATTDAKGEFSLANAPAGYYNTWAELPPYRMGLQAILHVPENGCGYTDVQFTTTSTLQGIVLDHSGRPAPKIPVAVWLRNKKLEDATDPWSLGTTTDGNGQFALTGVPDEDVYLFAGSAHPQTTMPYRRVYYPMSNSPEGAAVLRLKPGEHCLPVVLWLEPPLDKTTAKVRVIDKHGEPVVHAGVRARDDRHVILEFARTDLHGLATVPCLRGLKYELEAQAFRRLRWRGNVLTSLQTEVTCGDSSAELRLVVDHSAPY